MYNRPFNFLFFLVLMEHSKVQLWIISSKNCWVESLQSIINGKHTYVRDFIFFQISSIFHAKYNQIERPWHEVKAKKISWKSLGCALYLLQRSLDKQHPAFWRALRARASRWFHTSHEKRARSLVSAGRLWISVLEQKYFSLLVELGLEIQM